MSFLTRKQIKSMGFLSLGSNVMLSEKASYYNCSRIRLGSNIRIDDYCVLSAGIGGIWLGDYIHIGAGSTLIGAGKITLQDFSGLSSRVAVYSSNDDYSGEYLTNPTVPERFTNVRHADVNIGKHVIIGSGSVILPGINLGDGAVVGALSLVTSDCAPFVVYGGVPARRIKSRKNSLEEKEKELFSMDNAAGVIDSDRPPVG